MTQNLYTAGLGVSVEAHRMDIALTRRANRWAKVHFAGKPSKGKTHPSSEGTKNRLEKEDYCEWQSLVSFREK